MDVQEVLQKLESLGTEKYKNTLLKHGIVEPVYGVKIGDLKIVQKELGNNHDLALELYETKVYDAMYLAGLMADPERMTKTIMRKWLKLATSPTLREYTVPFLAAESKNGRQLAMEWLISTKPETAVAGWATMCSLVSIKDDDELNLPELKMLLKQVRASIHNAPDRVRYWMNNYVIAVGCYVEPLTDRAVATAQKIGKVTVDMGETDCKVPEAVPYIQKVQKRGSIGKKRKAARC